MVPISWVPEVKKRKYANQHKILAESVRKYFTEDDVLYSIYENGKLVLNLNPLVPEFFFFRSFSRHSLR